ncbi:MAG: hypothetical protein LQ348_006462, partial [Seirophora lacunosa]
MISQRYIRKPAAAPVPTSVRGSLLPNDLLILHPTTKTNTPDQECPLPLYHPLTAFVLSLTQCVFVLGFTPSTFLLRTPLGLAPILSYVYLAFHSSRSNLYLNALISSTASMALQYLDSALLSRWTYAAQGPTSGLGGQKCLRRESDSDGDKAHRAPASFTSRLRFGWKEAFRARSAASPWQVNNVPRFDSSRPEALPTKAQFVRTAALRCVLSLFVVDAVGWMGRDASMNAVHFAPGQVPVLARWREVTGEELALRVVSSLLHWMTFVCVLQAVYDGVAVVVVGLLGCGR